MKTVTTSSNIKDAFSGINLAEVNKTITSGLNKQEQLRYAYAVQKVAQGRALNLKDLKLLDRVDELTMQMHSMCLKDSLVTRARIKACKKYNMQFIDRDGLEEHMQMFYKSAAEMQENKKMDAKLGYLLIDRLGEEAMREFTNTTARLIGGLTLTKADLHLLANIEKIFNKELNASMLNDEMIEAVCKAGDVHGMRFIDLLKETVH